MRELHAGNELLVLNPYTISAVFAGSAAALELATGTRLFSAAALAALIAGWSSAWSP
jgi:hypothetical protein